MGLIARKRKRTTTYYVTFWHQGHRVFERAGADKQQAARLEAQRNREVRAGTYSALKHPGMALGRYAESYLDARNIRWAEEEAGYLRRHVLSREWLTRLAVGDLKPSHMRRLVAELKATTSKATGKLLSPKTISNIYGAFRTMVNQARVDELLAGDPCVLPRGTLQRKSKRTRAPYEPHHVLALTTDERIDSDRRVWNALAFYTGMREGEVCGRRWRDWDREARPLGCLTVATQYNDRPLKTERHQDDKPRKIPVHPQLKSILDIWWREGFEMMFA